MITKIYESLSSCIAPFLKFMYRNTIQYNYTENLTEQFPNLCYNLSWQVFLDTVRMIN